MYQESIYKDHEVKSYDLNKSETSIDSCRPVKILRPTFAHKKKLYCTSIR